MAPPPLAMIVTREPTLRHREQRPVLAVKSTNILPVLAACRLVLAVTAALASSLWLVMGVISLKVVV